MSGLRARLRSNLGWLLALQGIIVLTGVWFRWPSMSYALTEAHAFRQTQTTLMIREYMSGGLFQLSPLPVFGPPWQVPMEFPLFQWLAAVGGTVIGSTPQISGRLTALVFFEVSAILAAYLAHRWFSPAAGVATLGLFQFLPFGYQWGNAPLIEFLATAGALAAIACLDRWVQRPRVGWILGSVAGVALVALVKPTTALVWVPLYVAVAVDWHPTAFVRRNLARWPAVIPLAAGLVAAAAWTRAADAVKEDNAYSAFLTSANLSEWNFGTIDQRLDAERWQMILGYSGAIVGSMIAFTLLLLAAMFVWPRRAVLGGLALALPVGAMVFFNLYYMHTYYQSAAFPALVLIMGAGIGAVVRLAGGLAAKWGVAVVLLVAVLMLAWTSSEGQAISKRTVAGLYTFPLAEELATTVPDGAGVVMVGCNWDPTYFYLSGRRGLMVRPDAMNLPIPVDWIGSDLSYLALCDPAIDVKGLFPAGTSFEQVSGSVYRIVP